MQNNEDLHMDAKMGECTNWQKPCWYCVTGRLYSTSAWGAAPWAWLSVAQWLLPPLEYSWSGSYCEAMKWCMPGMHGPLTVSWVLMDHASIITGGQKRARTIGKCSLFNNHILEWCLISTLDGHICSSGRSCCYHCGGKLPKQLWCT